MENFWNKVKNALPCGEQPRPDNRTIYVGNVHPPGEEIAVPEKFPNNRIVSSKYTALNFLPKNLFEQFHRIANFYFLCVAFVEIVIDSPVSPWTSIIPLVFVLVTTAVKQGYEDWLRHKADKEVNHRPAHVIRDGQLTTLKSMDIVVGDIVRVSMNEGIACDMVMLSSEDPMGQGYLTTANLDGETNLKIFRCVPDTRVLQSDETFQDFRATIECEQPIEDLYKFVGRMTLHSANGENVVKPLGPDNVLLRGCTLKNTPFIYGCCIYTGQDTKISLNSKNKNLKISRVEKRMNIFLVVFLIALALYSGTWVGLKHWFYSFDENTAESMWYTEGQHAASFKVIIEEFLGFMVLCNYVIPISMYVTIELQKFFGSMFFAWDIEMYDPLTNEPARANTSDINEELGQVEYLFTDKTGTLTENVMEFRNCSINGNKYEEVGGMLCFRPPIPGVNPQPVPSLTPEIEEFLMVLALCHTCRVEKKDTASFSEYSETGMEYDYQASSPDEKAFVEACRRFGIIFHGVRNDKKEVTVTGKMRRFTQHHLLDFDPTRKRMSVIVEDEEGNKFLMCKGAETAILTQVVDGCNAQTVEEHIEDYARLGLRTLCIANRKLSEEEFIEIDEMLVDASQALDNRQDKLDMAYAKIEKNLKLLGATAVEDKLQDGVPETISALRQAGIQVWVLTGDKEETAVNISYAAGHFNETMDPVCLTKQASSADCRESLKEFYNRVSEATIRGEKRHCLVVDGHSLAFALEDHADLLRDVCREVITVLCCRMTPLQKAMVVRLIKHSPDGPTTAAIGDGANDVSMIQEAHVGLGIMGKEGRQAVRCSDYAFGRFKFVRRALLVHGHYYYIRMCTLVQYSFFKNVAMILAQLYFTFFSAFSEQTIIGTIGLTCYNTLYTSLPILINGVTEQHVRQYDLITIPKLYKTIKRNARLSAKEFLKWNLLGIWHSLVYFFGTYFLFSPGNAVDYDGQMFGIREHGTLIMATCVIGVNIKLMLETYYFNGIVIGSYVITFAGYFLLMFFFSAIHEVAEFFGAMELYGTLAKVFGSGTVWFCILIMVMMAIIPDILVRAIRDNFSDLYKHRNRKKKRKSAETTSKTELFNEVQPLATASPKQPRIYYNTFLQPRVGYFDENDGSHYQGSIPKDSVESIFTEQLTYPSDDSYQGSHP